MGTICAKPHKCAKYSSQRKTNDCQTQLIADKCVNCGGPHRTGNNMCRYTQQTADITRTALQNDISYAAAARRYHEKQILPDHLNESKSPIPQSQDNIQQAPLMQTAATVRAKSSLPPIPQQINAINNAPQRINGENKLSNSSTNSQHCCDPVNTILSNPKFVAMLSKLIMKASQKPNLTIKTQIHQSSIIFRNFSLRFLLQIQKMLSR